MGRPKRADEAGGIYHMLNRANRRETIFRKPADYDAFEDVRLPLRGTKRVCGGALPGA